jgi:corrinoid protein of di/trimethylamine methyltransferase
MTEHAQTLVKQLKQLVVEGDYDDKAAGIAGQALEAGAKPMEVIERGITDAMRVVGQKFESLEIFLPEMIRSAEVAQATLEVVKPHIPQGEGGAERGKVVLGTIKGDIHDIGKNIVRSVLSANGIEVIDLGKDVPLRNYIEEANRSNAAILGVSVLMSTSLSIVSDLVQLLEQEQLRDRYKIIVGGGCTNQEWAEKVGANAYGASAHDGANIIKNWLQ